jgi:hypothetical protein
VQQSPARPATEGGPITPLFRRRVVDPGQKAAAEAEIARLKALAPDELAAQVLPGLGPDGPGNGYSVRPQQLCDYLVRSFPEAGQLNTLILMTPVWEALQRLEELGLVAPVSVTRSPVWHLTQLGKATIADGTVRARLAGGDPQNSSRQLNEGE